VPFHAMGPSGKEQSSLAPEAATTAATADQPGDQPRAHHSRRINPSWRERPRGSRGPAARSGRAVCCWVKTQGSATSVVAQPPVGDGLYVSAPARGLSWKRTAIGRFHIQLVADLTAVAIESEWLQEDSAA